MKESSIEFQLFVAKDMGHIYPVFPSVKADDAREKIPKFIMNQTKIIILRIKLINQLC